MYFCFCIVWGSPWPLVKKILESIFHGGKTSFSRAKNLSVNTWRSGPDICSLICASDEAWISIEIKIRLLKFFGPICTIRKTSSKKTIRTSSWPPSPPNVINHLVSKGAFNGIMSFWPRIAETLQIISWGVVIIKSLGNLI